MWIVSSKNNILTPTCVALGNFDGIHRGHQQVVKPILSYAATKKVNTTVVTFNPHPKEFFTGESKKLLTPLREKIEQLEKLGVNQLVLLPFDRELASLSPQQFVEDILGSKLQASFISVGEDFCFGKDRKGTVRDLEAIAAKFKMKVNITPLESCQQERISSSLIRQALAKGDVTTANRLLGRAYSLSGKVILGKQLGRTIGFPTANLDISSTKFLPCFGVYLVRVKISDPLPISPLDNLEIDKWSGEIIIDESRLIAETWGVMNIGSRPTIAGKNTTVEVHLLDWSKNLYDLQISVSLEKFLRPEQKFSSLDALQQQIFTDCKIAKEIINNFV